MFVYFKKQVYSEDATFDLFSVLDNQMCVNWLPYILAYKSQNLRQNLAPKVRGATYPRVIKLRNFFQVPKYAISNVPVTNQYLELFIVSE